MNTIFTGADLGEGAGGAGRLSNTTGILQTPLLRKILGLLLFKNILGLNHRKRSDKNEKFSPRRDTFFRLQLYEKVRVFYELK